MSEEEEGDASPYEDDSDYGSELSSDDEKCAIDATLFEWPESFDHEARQMLRKDLKKRGLEEETFLYGAPFPELKAAKYEAAGANIGELRAAVEEAKQDKIDVEDSDDEESSEEDEEEYEEGMMEHASYELGIMVEALRTTERELVEQRAALDDDGETLEEVEQRIEAAYALLNKGVAIRNAAQNAKDRLEDLVEDPTPALVRMRAVLSAIRELGPDGALGPPVKEVTPYGEMQELTRALEEDIAAATEGDDDLIEYDRGLAEVQQIRVEQAKTDFVFSEINFERFLREVAQGFKTRLNFTPEAIRMLQTAAEQHMLERFQHANEMAMATGRVEVTGLQ